MDFFQYKNFDDFIQKMGFTTDQGIEFLDKELNKKGENRDKSRDDKTFSR